MGLFCVTTDPDPKAQLRAAITNLEIVVAHLEKGRKLREYLLNIAISQIEDVKRGIGDGP